MNLLEELLEWAKKVSSNKKDLDKTIFDELIKATITRLDNVGYHIAFDWLQEHYDKGERNLMNGVILLRNNSKQIKDKLWSLNQKFIKGKK